MKNFSESQVVINAVMQSVSEAGIGCDALNVALLSILLSSMRADFKDEHTLCDADGELLIVVKRYK